MQKMVFPHRYTATVDLIFYWTDAYFLAITQHCISPSLHYLVTNLSVFVIHNKLSSIQQSFYHKPSPFSLSHFCSHTKTWSAFLTSPLACWCLSSFLSCPRLSLVASMCLSRTSGCDLNSLKSIFPCGWNTPNVTSPEIKWSGFLRDRSHWRESDFRDKCRQRISLSSSTCCRQAERPSSSGRWTCLSATAITKLLIFRKLYNIALVWSLLLWLIYYYAVSTT